MSTILYDNLKFFLMSTQTQTPRASQQSHWLRWAVLLQCGNLFFVSVLTPNHLRKSRRVRSKTSFSTPSQKPFYKQHLLLQLFDAAVPSAGTQVSQHLTITTDSVPGVSSKAKHEQWSTWPSCARVLGALRRPLALKAKQVLGKTNGSLLQAK